VLILLRRYNLLSSTHYEYVFMLLDQCIVHQNATLGQRDLCSLPEHATHTIIQLETRLILSFYSTFIVCLMVWLEDSSSTNASRRLDLNERLSRGTSLVPPRNDYTQRLFITGLMHKLTLHSDNP